MASVKQSWIKKYGEEEGLRRWKELNAGKGTLEWYIKKHGEANGPHLYEAKNKKLSVSYAALKLSGKSDFEIQDIQHRHRERSKQTLDNMILRYGDVVGLARHLIYRERNKLTSNRRLDYWIKKCNGNVCLAKERLSEWQRRDKKWFIDKYGDVDGVERYTNMNKKRGRTLENYIKTYGNLVGLGKYNEACRNWKAGQKGIFNSKGQLEVEDFIRTLGVDVKGARDETGFILTVDEKTDTLTNNILYPDMIVSDRFIVEYNGDFWHARPSIFPDDTTIVGRVNKQAGVIRQIDKQKKQIYTSRGYTVIVIWDSDWHTNKDFIKNNLKQILL